MKVPWPKKFLILGIIVIWMAALVILDVPICSAQTQLLTRKEALIIAESSREVELFYKLNNGRLKNCIHKEVIKPCESDWVTCIEDAWVVQFTVGDICPVVHDGRLGITFLIDAITGRIVSRFPEVEYFETAGYCLEDFDCLDGPANGSEGAICQNFIFGQLKSDRGDAGLSCICQNNKCIEN